MVQEVEYEYGFVTKNGSIGEAFYPGKRSSNTARPVRTKKRRHEK